MSVDNIEQAATSEEVGTAEFEDNTEQSTEAADEAGTSEAQESASVDVDESQEESDEWLEPGRFKTGKDAVKSYHELERVYHQTASEIDVLRKQIRGLTEKPSDPNVEIEEFAKIAEKNPVEAVRREARRVLEEQVRQQREQNFNSVYAAAQQNEEFRALEPAMTQISNSFSDLLSPEARHDPRVLNALFLMAKGLKAHESIKQAEAKGAKKGEQMARKKVKAQIEGGSAAKGKRSYSPEEFDKLPLNEQRKLLESGEV